MARPGRKARVVLNAPRGVLPAVTLSILEPEMSVPDCMRWFRPRLLIAVPLAVFALFGLVQPVNAADPVKVGGEITVTTDGDGHLPRIAVDPGGNFLIVWEATNGLSEMQARAFWSNGNPQGPEFQMSKVGHILGGNGARITFVDVAADKAGNFVAAYNGYGDEFPECGSRILTRRRDSEGALAPAVFVVGDPRLFSYNQECNQTSNPKITADGEGNFVVAWEGYDADEFGDLNSEGVWARKMVSSGQVNGSQFLVHAPDYTYQGQYGQLDVAADDTGNFVVVWHDESYVAEYEGLAVQRFDKSKNPLGPRIQVTTDAGLSENPQVAVMPDGKFMVVWDGIHLKGQVHDADGVPTGPVFEVAGAEYPEVSASASGLFVVVFEDAGGIAGQVVAETGAVTSGVFQVSTVPGGYRPTIGAADDGSFVVTWARFGNAYAQRFAATPPIASEIPLLGKVAVISNKIPDDFEKSNGKWKAGGEEIVVPLRGSSSDPRCNGDAVGTVKASVRFLSVTSGQDTGPIPLPCQNWDATGGGKVGSVPKRGYKYSDGKRLDGPCTSVKIKGTKSLSVTCKGKPGAAAFTYDLVSGVGQGPVTAVLEMGLVKYCAEFEPFFDGSDGKKYKGKSLSVPASCP